MCAKLLVVEDEPSMLKGLVDVLQIKAYEVDSVQKGDQALDMARTGSYDLMLLDVMLPGLSGFEVLKQLRESGDQTPVILLTAKNSELDKVLGFELGVDDYVTKPFSLLELLGRISAVLRRATVDRQPVEQDLELLNLGRVEINLRRGQIWRDGEALELPYKGLEILRYLSRQRGRIVNRDELIGAIWEQNASIHQRTVDNWIMRIRQVIEEDPANPRYLRTIYGAGYCLDFDDIAEGVASRAPNGQEEPH